MIEPSLLHFTNGHSALARDLGDRDDLPEALHDLGPARPVLVLVGGADSLDRETAQRIAPFFRDALVPLFERTGSAVIDGGTDSGLMALVGQARVHAGASFPLIGVAARGTALLPGDEDLPGRGSAPLEPNHTHFLLVPGNHWGDESSWIMAAATVLANGAPSATLAAGGGKVTELDLNLSLQAGRPTLLLADSGGTTGRLAAALRAHGLAAFGIDERKAGFLRAVDLSSAAVVLDGLLRGSRSS